MWGFTQFLVLYIEESKSTENAIIENKLKKNKMSG